MTTIHDREEIVKKIESDDLKSEDYGCDGSDECCGTCGGNYLSEHLVVDYILTLLEENRLKTIDEAIGCAPKDNFRSDMYARGHGECKDEFITNLNQLKK